MAVHVRRLAYHAARLAGVGGEQIRCPAFAGVDEPDSAHSGLEGDVSGHALRRQRHVESGVARDGSGDVL